MVNVISGTFSLGKHISKKILLPLNRSENSPDSLRCEPCVEMNVRQRYVLPA